MTVINIPNIPISEGVLLWPLKRACLMHKLLKKATGRTSRRPKNILMKIPLFAKNGLPFCKKQLNMKKINML